MDFAFGNLSTEALKLHNHQMMRQGARSDPAVRSGDPRLGTVFAFNTDHPPAPAWAHE